MQNAKAWHENGKLRKHLDTTNLHQKQTKYSRIITNALRQFNIKALLSVQLKTYNIRAIIATVDNQADLTQQPPPVQTNELVRDKRTEQQNHHSQLKVTDTCSRLQLGVVIEYLQYSGRRRMYSSQMLTYYFFRSCARVSDFCYATKLPTRLVTERLHLPPARAPILIYLF